MRKSTAFVALTVTLLCLLVAQTAYASSYSCIEMLPDSSLTSATIVDLNSFTIRTTTLPYRDLDARGYFTPTISPNEHYITYVRNDKSTDNVAMPTGTLIIAPLNDLGEIGKEVVIHSNIPLPNYVTIGKNFSNGANRDIVGKLRLDPVLVPPVPPGPLIAGTQMLWTPDSRWLVYRWSIDAKHYIGIASPDGKMSHVDSVNYG